MTPFITGPVSEHVIRAGTGMGAYKTGTEYSDIFRLYLFERFSKWGVDVVATPAEGELVTDRAIQTARDRPFVAGTLPDIPTLTDNLVSDVRALTRLTSSDLGELAGVTERTILEWRRKGKVPPEHRALLQALRAIGLTLIGGLGRTGVNEWLTLGGDEAPLMLLQRGAVADVQKRVREFEDSIAG